MELEFEEIKQFFLDEAGELFEKIDAVLLAAEDSGAFQKDDIDSLFRFFHTLKGNSATVGLRTSAKITHELESFLSKLKNGQDIPMQGVSSMLMDSTEIIRKTVFQEVENPLDEEEATQVIKFITDSVNGNFNKQEVLEQEQKGQPQTQKETPKEQNQIKVDLSKVDFLMNILGEIVITVSMLNKKVESIKDERVKVDITEKISFLERQLKEMQDSAMSIRMVPIRQIYSKIPRQVRDLAKKLGKKVELVQTGEDVEIDKAITDGLTDAIMHMVRNSLDHGIEPPHERKAAGKSDGAKLAIEASQQNGQILIKIKDDGRGIDPQKIASKAVEKGLITKEKELLMSDEEKIGLIFAPGFSTAESVTDVSGRGVGMDVVMVNITKLGGSIRVASEVGKYTTVIISLPLTLAVMDGLSVGVGKREFILPVATISETLQPLPSEIKRIGEGSGELLSIRGEFVPIVRVHKLLGIEPKSTTLADGILLIVSHEERKAALFVDEYRSEGQVAVKSIEKNFVKMSAFSAATVKADGSIGLILDVGGLLEMQKQLEKKRWHDAKRTLSYF